MRTFEGLAEGDIVRNIADVYRTSYIVTTNYGDRVTAVRTVDMTNPSEWELVSKAKRPQPGVARPSPGAHVHSLEDTTWCYCKGANG